MSYHINYRILRIITNPISGDKVTVGVLHWDGKDLRFKYTLKPVPEDFKDEAERVLISLQERVAEFQNDHTKSITDDDLSYFFPVPEGRGSLFHWARSFSGLASSGEQHFIELVKALKLDESINNIEKLKAKIIELENLVYVPGVWVCAKCKLSLVSNTLNANDGSIYANTNPQKCPNGCGPLWRKTERQAGNELCDRLDKLEQEFKSEIRWVRDVNGWEHVLIRGSQIIGIIKFDHHWESFKPIWKAENGFDQTFTKMMEFDFNNPDSLEAAKEWVMKNE